MKLSHTFVRCMAVLGFVVLALPAPAHAFLMRGSVLGNGATPAAGSTGSGRAMRGTVGQAAIGISGAASSICCHGFWCFGGSRVVAVEDDVVSGPSLPTELSFGIPSPNPSRGTVAFELALPKAASVDLAIYDVAGRTVDRLTSETMGAGYHTLRWDGARATGAAGVYFARLVVSGRMVGQRRMVLVR